MAQSAPSGHCPVCGVRVGAEVTACPRCETQHHPDCWEFAGGCAIYGCEPAVATRTALALPGTLLEERPTAAPIDALVVQAPAGHDWIDPLPGPVSPFWWAGFAALAPFGSLGLVFLPGLPYLFARLGWRFDVEGRYFEHNVTALGIPMRRRRIPLDDIVRLEIRDDEVHIRLVVVLRDGTSLELQPSVEDDPLAWRRLRAVARGVQLYAGIHVTSALRMDPESLEKRLIALKASVEQVAGRARFLNNVSTATAGALFGIMLIGGSSFPALALFTMAHLIARSDGTGGPDQPYLRDGLLRPSALPELERQVRSLAVSREGAVAYAIGSALLAGSAFLWAGTLGAGAALVAASIGSVVGMARWSRARGLAKLIPGVELGKDELAPDRVAQVIGDAVGQVRRGMLGEHTRQRIADLRWEIATRRAGGVHGFRTVLAAIVFVVASAAKGMAATVITMVAAMVAMYGLFLSANLVKWRISGKPVEELEEELKVLLAERQLLAGGARAPELTEAASEEKPAATSDPKPEKPGED